ncbi:toll/interleukin-1 receptor domain-containing protein, partial [Methylosinus sp. R-45379]|uniref:toll/interleukin-1 receptor domain-containing protein n=1 Tax=Methylosinus sp. R-45379 TaxID=980563 RepID=UPI000AD664E7
MTRDTIFISHATPDDNDFVRWLGNRLIGHGYKVWADLFDLNGGTPFWTTIEEAIRTHTVKVVFVVSRKSVDPNRSGVRNELSVADAVKKAIKDPGFVIPVRIDDTDFGDFPIQIHRLNAIDFTKGWGGKLVELLKTFEDAGVRRAGEANEEFEIWRNVTAQSSILVEDAPEKVLTNLIAIEQLPKVISFYEFDGDKDKIAAAIRDTGIPFYLFNRLIISFAGVDAFQELLPPAFRLKARAQVPFGTFLAGEASDVTAPAAGEARKIATSLLRQ